MKLLRIYGMLNDGGENERNPWKHHLCLKARETLKPQDLGFFGVLCGAIERVDVTVFRKRGNA